MIRSIRLENFVKKPFIELIFSLAAGEIVKLGFRYEDQLRYYVKSVLNDDSHMNDFINFGLKCRSASKLLFPNNPNQIKNNILLIKLFSNFAILKQMHDWNEYKKMKNHF